MHHRGGAERPAKRVKLDPTLTSVQKFADVEEIRASLRTQDQHRLTEALTTLRNQLTVKFGEASISPQDERLLLAQKWLEAVPGAHDLFNLWEGVNQHQATLTVAIISVLSTLLNLLSSHYSFHSLGQPILKLLLSPPWIRRLNSYLGGSQNELILVTLKIFNSMSAFANGKERKQVLELFAWETKSLPKLMHMRRRTKTDAFADTLARPDIRTLYILFILAFVGVDSPTSVKAAFLERHRDAFLSIFKGIVQDSYSVVRKVLEVCWAGIWSDLKLKRTLKITLFNETTFSHIIKLYDRVAQEGPEPDHVPADLVHHFMLAICTRPGTGICFKDRGWYPRVLDTDDGVAHGEEEELKSQKSGKIHNIILANLLKALKINEDPRQQELAVKVLEACPELVSGYWAGAALTFEPRLSSKWITNISFLGTVISLPVPSSSFSIPDSTLYHPTPPPLVNILENVVPSAITKIYLSKGLQSTSPLVQHCTALTLAKCLIKYENVVRIFQEVAHSLEEDEDDGQWYKRRKDITTEVRRRIPDFQVIVGFSQQRINDGSSSDSKSSQSKVNPTTSILLGECALRLLWLYHRCMPTMVAEARFDLGKLLPNFLVTQAKVAGEDGENDTALDSPARLHVVRQLHVLRLLKESDQFVWSGKLPSSPHSYLHVLLKSYVVTDVPATRLALKALICHLFSTSIMFQEDGDEPWLWLASLPTTQRVSAQLSDEGDSVITFLDDCVQRCLKTPYRYVDDMNTLLSAESGHCPEASNFPVERPDVYLSPLLMTVLEQLGAKVVNKLLSPLDILALASFVRKLVFKLSMKQQSLRFLCTFVDKVDDSLRPDHLALPDRAITAAIRREVSIIHYCLDMRISPITRHIEAPERKNLSNPSTSSNLVLSYLKEIETWPVPQSKAEGIVSAFQIVDWCRLLDYSLSLEEFGRVAAVVERCHKPALKDIIEILHPADGLLWDGLKIVMRFAELSSWLDFDWLFVQCRTIEDPACRDILVETLFTNSISQNEVKRALCLVIHRLASSEGRDAHSKNLFFLLSSIIKKAKSLLPSTDVDSLKEFVFLQSQFVAGVSMSEKLAQVLFEGLAQFIEIILNPTMAADRKFAAHITAHWVAVLRVNIESGLETQAPYIKLWIKYLEADDLFDLLDFMTHRIDDANAITQELLITILDSLRLSTSESQSESALKMRLKHLVNLRSVLSDVPILEEMIATALNASLPIGHDGFSRNHLEPCSLAALSSRAETRSFQRSEVMVDEDQFHSFLIQESWSLSTIQIISSLLYCLPSSRNVFLQWLGTDNSASRSASDLAHVLHAFLDASLAQGDDLTDRVGDGLVPQCSQLFTNVVDPENSTEFRILCSSCIVSMVMVMPSKRPEFLSLLELKVQLLPANSLTSQLLVIGNRLHSAIRPNDLTSSFVNHGLQWTVRHLSGDDGNLKDAQNIFRELTALIASGPNIKSHYSDTVLTVAIKNCLSDTVTLNLLIVLVKFTALKPLTVNRHLQSIIQHPKFFKFCEKSEPGDNASRDAIVHILHVLFHTHPSNTCHPTHVDPLVRIYGGTSSTSDSKLLSIFQLFESQRKTSVASMITRWSPSSNLTSSDALDAIHNLDSAKVLRTCLAFPKWRRFSGLVQERDDSVDAQLYDPVFLILLFSRMLSESLPTSAFAWVELFRTNIVGLLIRCMSSKDDCIRELALCQIVALWKCLETADMQEKPHVTHLLNILKDTLPPPSEAPPTRLPSYSSLILLHALRGIFYPSNFIYPLTANFLLQRPELDTNDVPMLYAMLYSSSDDWKKERAWIIRFLSNGMLGSGDWRVLKRRHTWDLLASFFQSTDKNRNLRHGILEVLANLTCNTQATMSLVLKSGLLTWIEMQLLNTIHDEGMAWFKILQNIITIVDHVRLESVTNGAWRAVICRCLSLLLDDNRPASTMSILGMAAPIILQLGLLPGSTISYLSPLITKAVDRIKRLEESMDTRVHGLKRNLRQRDSTVLSLHAAHGLHVHPSFDNPLQLWGESVEMLWRTVMGFREKHPAWETLTCRLLLWRSIVGEEGSRVGEWARREVIQNLSIQDDSKLQI